MGSRVPHPSDAPGSQFQRFGMAKTRPVHRDEEGAVTGPGPRGWALRRMALTSSGVRISAG